ncbi:hypothetical protein Angca_000252, partial [Angiostrongylus cantonensis]
ATRNVNSPAEDYTIKDEKHFLNYIEKYKNRRLERFCICPATKWLLFKEELAQYYSVLCRIERCLWILCCPPLCYIIPQVAFWPPPNEYFFYIDNNNMPRIRREVEGHQEAIEIAKRKKELVKVYRANKQVCYQFSDPGGMEGLISDIQVPVLVIHGEDDRKVPIAHGKAVCEKAVNRVSS